MKVFQDLKLGTKLLLSFFVVTAVAVGMVTLFNDRSTRNFFMERVGNEFETIANAQGQAIGDLLVSQIHLIESFALHESVITAARDANSAYSGDLTTIQNEIDALDKKWRDAPDNDPLIQSRLKNKVSGILLKYNQDFPDHVEIFITDKYGALLASTGRTSDYNQADEGWWQSAYNNGSGAVYIAEPEFDESSQTLSINLAVPIYEQNNQTVIGVLRTTYNLTAVQTMLNRIRMGETGDIDLWLPGGVTFSGKDGTLQTADQETQQFITNMSGGYAEGIYNNVPSLVSRVKITATTGEDYITNLNWELVANQSTREILKPVQRTTTQSLMVSVLALLLAVGLGYLIARWIRTPILNLAQATQQIATGDLDVNINTYYNDEVGGAIKAFKEMVAYLQNMAWVANQIANGDLTVQIQPQSDKDNLGNAFAKMILNLRVLIAQVIDNASQLSAASVQLVNGANQASQATSQIATTIQQIAKGTSQQSAAVTRTASSVEQMSRAIDGVAKGAQEQSVAVSMASNVTSQITAVIQQVAANANASAVSSTQAAETARAGVDTVEKTIKGMENIRVKVGLSAQKVKEMGEHSSQIGAIIETIDDIASQTNLLALNAAIEAARAGEAGKGFAVVADEVRKLAERASSATKEIGGLIQGIQSTVTDAVRAMEEGAREVELGAESTNQAGQALMDIRNAVQAVNQQVSAIADAAQQMAMSSNDLVNAMDSVSAVVEENTAATEQIAASSNEFTQAIENIASVNEENSAAVEEVSAAAEEVSAQVDEVTTAAESLNVMARAMQDSAARFKI